MTNKFTVMRRAVLMEDEGTPQDYGSFNTLEDAEEWIKVKGCVQDYFKRGDFYIVTERADLSR